MNIDSIQNGFVIDHIAAGCGMKLYNLLGLDDLDVSVAIIKNVTSKKLGKKDIIKMIVVTFFFFLLWFYFAYKRVGLDTYTYFILLFLCCLAFSNNCNALTLLSKFF